MSKKILILDDDLSFLNILARSLEQKNFIVTKATNLEEAEQVIKKKNLDYAIFDLRLKDANSLDFIKTAIAIQSHLKILILTGYASITSVVNAIKLGANNYLAKPAKIDEIILALETEYNEVQTVSTASIKLKEMEIIQNCLLKNNFNISKTAKELNMHRRTLQRKLHKKILS